jgi:hypothetical protein
MNVYTIFVFSHIGTDNLVDMDKISRTTPTDTEEKIDVKNLTVSDVKSLKMAELKAELRRLSISYQGSKVECVARLEEALNLNI